MVRLRSDSLLLGALISLVFLTGAVPVAFLLTLLLTLFSERLGLDLVLGPILRALWHILVFSPMIYKGLVIGVGLGLVLAVFLPPLRRLLGKLRARSL